MWARKRIDIGWSDLLSAAVNCLWPGSHSAAAKALESSWSDDGRSFACLSVRTGFELVLGALALPAGSEVLISALTIPDMVRIVVEHDLVPVPIDLNYGDASPQFESLEELVTPRTKAILVAHLFGGRFDLNPFVEFARKHRLVLLEDCAQTFDGSRFRGHDDADVSMFSFGPIKTATALGGGLLRIKDASLLAKVRALQSNYSVQSRWQFAKRVLRYAALRFLGGRIAFSLFVQLCRMTGRNMDQMLQGSIRNFPPTEFFRHLRLQPSLPLLRLMRRRITRYQDERLELRTARGRLLMSLLPPHRCPGGDAQPHNFWVFPVEVTDAPSTIAALQTAGFDATAQNSLKPVEPSPGRPGAPPLCAQEMSASVLYLPLDVAMPEAEIRRMADVFQTCENVSGSRHLATSASNVMIRSRTA